MAVEHVWVRADDPCLHSPDFAQLWDACLIERQGSVGRARWMVVRRHRVQGL
ncbi:hypothetical protein BDZ85DRAFT_259248 [Elsinoe ampelina]|uniref:Uncharacterized protein n=1 Tax=Elsinoe ampelina TaxID=302913 RepID=A0A6A6GGZ4_9PEZI|nr:hypothetical protein BDZ85DRAFT_259248 [Elsinoe ampelina]